MDFQDQLKNLFPDHEPLEDIHKKEVVFIGLQSEPLICKYEKRKGKPITIIEGYNGSEVEFKLLAKKIKIQLSVGGSFKNRTLIIQGDFRDTIMHLLVNMGFKVKRVGG
jgi:translation initiation factor 1